MTLKEKLQAARALIADPDTWCTLDYAQNGHGFAVDSTSPDACRFCALGAAFSIENHEPIDDEDEHATETTRALTDASLELFAEHVVLVNDSEKLGHAAVLKIYDHAIERAS